MNGLNISQRPIKTTQADGRLNFSLLFIVFLCDVGVAGLRHHSTGSLFHYNPVLAPANVPRSTLY